MGLLVVGAPSLQDLQDCYRVCSLPHRPGPCWAACWLVCWQTHSLLTLQVFNIFNALGTIAFAYGGHNVVRHPLTVVIEDRCGYRKTMKCLPACQDLHLNPRGAEYKRLALRRLPAACSNL